MRNREVMFKDFRSFRGERRISFVNPVTEAVHPLTVLGGSNGCGKTTVLEAIEALLAFLIEPDKPKDLIREAWDTGLIQMTLELSYQDYDNIVSRNEFKAWAGEMGDQVLLHIAVGRRDLAPESPDALWPNLFCEFRQRGSKGKPFRRLDQEVAIALQKAVRAMLRGDVEMHGGLAFFPHDRRLGQNVKRRTLQAAPPKERQWLFKFYPSDRWEDSLESLWLWQDYLDLLHFRETGEKSRTNLAPFVELVEHTLGAERRIVISTEEGRVQVPAYRQNSEEAQRFVSIDQLPSGEQQVVLMFGELARRVQRGAVIMIDEVENSLHPALQQKVMWNLRRLARDWDAQFITTTHSREVIETSIGSGFINLDYPDEARFYHFEPDTEADREAAA